MFREMRSERTDQCFSDLQLDAWHAKLLAGEQARALAAHLPACSRCREREASLRSQRERFDAAHQELPDWLDPTARARPRAKLPKRWLLSSAALAAVAALAFVALPSDSVRTKGSGDSLSFYVKRGEQVRRGVEGEAVRPGDQLRFAYTTVSARYLTILSLDGAQRTSVYFPEEGQDASVRSGTERLLPTAIELDDAPGEERIFALFCAQPPDVAKLRAELDQKHTVVAPPGCARDQFSVIKEAATP